MMPPILPQLRIALSQTLAKLNGYHPVAAIGTFSLNLWKS